MNTIRKSALMRAAIGAVALSLTAGAAGAAVIQHADVGGFRTFQDTSTGRVWLDMDNFFNVSTEFMLGQAAAAGFSFASRADVQELLGSLPLGSGQWAGYAAIMGRAPNRGLIWGSYDDGGDPEWVAWAWAYSDDLSWSIAGTSSRVYEVPNAGSAYADMNIWAYQTGNVVPEPATLALLGLGLAGLRFARRR